MWFLDLRFEIWDYSMKNFISQLETTQEVGYVEKALKGIVHVAGLPSAKNHELVLSGYNT